MTEFAAAMALEHYGVKGTTKQLDGYEDLNFMLLTEEGTRFIIKLTTNQDFETLLRVQNKVLSELSSQPTTERKYPNALESLSGSKMIKIQDVNGRPYLLRMLEFVEGEFLANVDYTDEMLRSLGAFVATMDKAMMAMHHPELIGVTHEWDHAHFLDIEQYMDALPEPKQKRLIAYCFLQYKEVALPVLKPLRKTLLHNDPNDWNVLVQNGKVSGIIDFGDLVHTHLVCELGILIGYTAQKAEDPLACAARIIEGYAAVVPLQEEELRVVYYLAIARMCTTIVMAAHSSKLSPDNEYIGVHFDSAWALLQKWMAISPIRAENTFREVCGYAPLPVADANAALAIRSEHISQSLSTSYNAPIYMERAALQYMFDDAGNTYLDGVNNIMHVGHCHPKVVRAGQAQMAKMNTNTRYLYDQLHEYAAKLAAKFPAPLTKIFFVNSGSAASDLAIRLARAHTKRHDVMVVDHGYHGNTSTAIDLSAYKYEGKGGGGQAPYIHKAPIPDTYRGAIKASDPDAGIKYAAEVQALLDGAEKPIAAFICESIIGCGGQVMLPEGYLEKVYAAVRDNGGVCIADEVQTGFGRVGSHFWAFERANVVPDIVVMGKPMGNGHPLAAVITTDEIAASFETGMEFFSSFGGNPVSCAVGLAVLDVIEEEGLQQHALELGEFLIAGFEALQAEYPQIGDVRGAGLFLGIELVDDVVTLAPATGLAKAIVEDMKSKFILLSTDGPHNNVIKFKPPMCFSKENAELLLSEFGKSLKAVLAALER